MNKWRESKKFFIATIICIVLILLICLAMVNYWLDYSTYHYPALICVIVLTALAGYFFIVFWIKIRKGE